MKNFSEEPTDPEAQDIIRYSSNNPPQEAINVINRSERYDMHPDEYDAMKDVLNPEAQLEERIPASVSPALKSYASKSSNHAKVVEGEVGILDKIAKHAGFISYNLWSGRSDELEIRDLFKRKRKEGKLPEHEEEYLTNLISERDEKISSFELEGYEQIPGQAATVVADMVSAVGNNKALIGSTTLAGAAVGLSGVTFAPVTVLGGAATGFGLGLTSAFGKDAYERIADSSYDQLGRMTGEDGLPLNLSENTKSNISVALGITSGVLETATGGALTFGLGKLASKKVMNQIVTNTGLKTALDVLGHTVKTGGISSIEETSSEIASIVSENYAKGHKSEAGLLNAIWTTIEQIAKDPETRKRLTMTAAVGATAGGGAAFATGAVTSPKIKSTYEKSNAKIRNQESQKNVINEALRALNNKEEIVKMSKASLDTDLKRMSPEQMSEFRKQAFTEAGYTEKIWFSQEDIATLKTSNPEIAARIIEMDMTEGSRNKTESFVGLESHQFLDLVDDAPTVADFARLHPEAPNPLESKNLLERFNNAQLKRQEIFSSLGKGEELSPEQTKMMLDLDKEIEESTRGAGVMGYINDAVTFTENIEGVVPDKQVEALNIAQRAARIAVADLSIQDFDAREQRIENKVVKLNEKIEKEIQLKKIETDLKVVDKFKPMKGEKAEKINWQELSNLNQNTNYLTVEYKDGVKNQPGRVNEIQVNKVGENNYQVNTTDGYTSEDVKSFSTLEEAKKEAEKVFKNLKEKVETPSKTTKKTSYSPLAIDPKYLPDNLREAYITEPKLIKRKVFVEGGITPDEAATLAGVKDGETLLKILANAPSRNELIAQRKARSVEIRKMVKESRSVNVEERRNKIFDDLNAAHLKEVEFMRTKEWPGEKLGIKKVMLPLPKIAELNNTARKVIANTRVADLRPRQYNAAEKSLQIKAANHILKNEVEQAFVAKEKGMLNVELTRESLKARDAIDNARDVIKRISSKEGINTLKKSGLLNKVNEILGLFDLIGTDSKAVRRDSYFEYLQKLNDQGESIVVPEELADIRQRGKDLTVEQYLRVTERLQTLEHQAKLKNKLLKKLEKREKMNQIETEAAIVEDAVLDLQNHPSYDEKRLLAVKNKNSKDVTQRSRELFGKFSSMISNFKNVVTTLDKERLGEKHYNILAQPMINSETFERQRNLDVVNQQKKIIAAYGEKEFTAAFNEFIEIPEFKGYEHLGNGKLAKSDLWRLMSNLGDPTARERIQNFKNATTGEAMTVESVEIVLDRVLTSKDAQLVQNYINIFKSFEQEAMDLHERTTGVKPNMVKGVPFTHRGRVYEGGYVPLDYLATSPTERASRFLEVLGDKSVSMFGEGEEGKLYSLLRSAEMTEQGRLIDRKKSSRPLDTDFRTFIGAFEEHIHDLAYRESGSDVLKLLKNPIYSNAIISTVGVEKYNTMTSGVIETVGQNHGEDILSPYAGERKAVENLFKHLEQGFSVGTLGFKLSSVLMQPLSMFSASLRLGRNGPTYLLKSTGQVLKSLVDGSFNKLYEHAIEINPDLKFNQDSIDDSLVKSQYDLIPKSNNTPYANKLAMLKKGKELFVEAAMYGLKKMDIYNKVLATHAAYAQFVDGAVENFPQSKLDKMTPEEIQVAGKNYAKQMADLALTTSANIDKNALEKIGQMRMFTRFYTDLRSQANTFTSQNRKILGKSKEAVSAYKSGDTGKAALYAKNAALDLGALLTTYTLTKLYIDTLRDEETPITDLANVENMGDFGKFLSNTASYVATAPIEGFASSVPLVRDIQFAVGGYGRVNFPITQTFTDVVQGIVGVREWMNGNELSKKEIRGLLFSGSYLVGGFPVKGLMEINTFIQETSIPENFMNYVQREIVGLSEDIDKFSEKHKDDPKAQETIAALKEIQAEYAPNTGASMENLIPEDSMEVLKTDDWKALDPVTGGAGVYQFTEERWKEISEENPDLGLTEDGRVSKDPGEQEKAMKYSLEQNARGLANYQVEVDNANLYGAHRFGLDDYVSILMSNDNEKLTNVVENKKLFEGFKTVGQVRKFVRQKIEKINKLTLK